VSASRDGTVRSWKLPSIPDVNPLFSHARSASADDSVEVSVFEQHDGYVSSLAFHPDGKSCFDLIDSRTRSQRRAG
jgi:WD40 repeat protein